jgi:hypothetical protein
MRGREGLQRALKLLFEQDGREKRRQEGEVNTRRTVATQAFQTRIRNRCAGRAQRNSVQKENALGSRRQENRAAYENRNLWSGKWKSLQAYLSECGRSEVPSILFGINKLS